MNSRKWILIVVIIMAVISLTSSSVAFFALQGKAKYCAEAKTWEETTSSYQSLLEEERASFNSALAAGIAANDRERCDELEALDNYYLGQLTQQEAGFTSRLATAMATEDVVKNAEISQLKEQFQEQSGSLNTKVQDQEDLIEALRKSLREDEDVIKGIEDWLLREELNTVTSLKPVIFFPSDVERSQWLGDNSVAAIERALKVAQIWFQKEIGVTFSLEGSEVIQGKNTAKYYDSLEGEAAFRTIVNEVPSSRATIIFLASDRCSNDLGGWGGWGNGLPYPAALVGIEWYYLLSGDSPMRYETIALMVHELGHLWGLPHLITNDDAALMKVDETGAMTSQDVFPLANLSEQEKSVLAYNMRRR